MERIVLILSEPLLQQWLRDLGWTFIQFLWQGTLLAFAYAIARRFVSAQGRYRLAVGTLIAMTAAPMWTFTTGQRIAAEISWPTPGIEWERILPTLAIAWAAGALFFSIRLVLSWHATRMLRKIGVEIAPQEWLTRFRQLAARMNVSDSVQFLLSSCVQTPATIGWLKPLVFFPASMLTGLPPSHVEALLAHELAHVKRMDYAVNILQSFAEAILFYHPAVWWVSRQIRTEREFICDDLAAAACGDTLEYARALTELESARVAGLALAANDGPLLRRIRRLLAPEATTSVAPAALAAIAMSALWIAGTGNAIAQAPATAIPMVVAQRPPSPAPSLLFAPFGPSPQAPAARPAQEQPKTFRVMGRVVIRGTNDAIARAEIREYKKKTDSAIRYVPAPILSASDGSFILENIEPGEHWLDVSRSGFLPLNGNVISSPAFLKFVVEPDRNPVPLTIPMTPQAVITGEVIDSFGDPVRPAYVEVFRLAYSSGRKQKIRAGRTFADDQGRFRIPMLEEGSYYVLASPDSRTNWEQIGLAPHALTLTPLYYPGVTSLETAVPVKVTAGSTSAITIRLSKDRLYSIRGRVEYEGPTIPGMFMHVIPAEESAYADTTETGPFGNRRVLPDGKFEITDLPPGRYIVGARVCLGDKGNQCYDGNTGVPKTHSTSVEVAIRSSDVENVVIAVRNPITVEGTIRLENGDFRSVVPPPVSSPVPFDQIGLLLGRMFIGLVGPSVNERYGLGDPDEKGEFHLLLPEPAVYRAQFVRVPPSVYVKSVLIDGQDALRKPVYVTASARMEVLLAEHPAMISGVIRDADGHPQPGVTVTLWPTDLTLESPTPAGTRTVTADDGTFKFSSLGPGEYHVAAWELESALSGILYAPAFLAQFSTQAETVRLDAGQSVEIAPKLIPASAIAEAAAKLP